MMIVSVACSVAKKMSMSTLFWSMWLRFICVALICVALFQSK